ncbi:LolA family protein [Sediminibacterium goheungense]|uniref:Outer membrane lipoprotein-sorting protein n=1 Tax=Sediminibacterium goheungense TaxID=1086393 RepID=A0A4R6IYX3_9BACT|nr:outer membrane lipoprotein carrier protein LolA [Sediminibacterium goheungense]TDO28023.1 outer membrane lipoprotein-sorting protein [Sediminibacterium goheungense]
MKKLYSVALVILAMVFQVQAQNDPNAKKILDAVSKTVKTYKTISAGFSIKSVSSRGVNNGTKTGTIVTKGEKYVLKEGKTEILCDGAKTYNFDGSKTITVSAVEDAGQTLTPQKILSGSYDKDFTYRLIATKGNVHEIEMKPIDSRKNFSKVNIFVDKIKNMITRAVILDKGNNTVQVSFTNIVPNKNLADNLFVFNPSKYPKDVEILD